MYYWAAHLSILAWWKKGPQSDADWGPAWLHTERSVRKKPSLLALLNSPTTVKRSHFSNSFVVGNTLNTFLFGTVVAKKLILRVWKLDLVPTFDLWLREMALHLERLTLYNKDRGDVFWDPVLQFLQGKD